MLADYKAHRRPPRPPPRRKAGGASSPLSGGKEPQGGLPNPESGRWIWWEKKEDKDSPVFIPSTWSICDSHERSQRSALISAKRAGTARNAGEGSLLKERLRERARSVFFFFFFFLHGQSAPSRAALALLSSRQHTDCVYPQQRKLFVCREEHTACNAICSRQVLVLLCTYSYRGSYPECLWDTANRNKLQQISTDTHSGCWMTKADAGSTARAFMLPGRLRHPPVTSRPSVGQITHVFRARLRWWRSLSVFWTQLEFLKRNYIT